MLVGWFKRTIRDPVTGWEFTKDEWPIHVTGRRQIAEFMAPGPIPARSDDAGYPRVQVAVQMFLWLVGPADEQANRKRAESLSHTIEFVMDRMSNYEFWLLLHSVPAHTRAPDLPDPSALRAAIKAIPSDPASVERHQWRFDMRTRLMLDAEEHGRPAAHEHHSAVLDDWMARQREGMDEEIQAGYCGVRECGHCEDPDAHI